MQMLVQAGRSKIHDAMLSRRFCFFHIVLLPFYMHLSYILFRKAIQHLLIQRSIEKSDTVFRHLILFAYYLQQLIHL